jgi:hypothetical protein
MMWALITPVIVLIAVYQTETIHPELTSDYSLFVYTIRSPVTMEYYLCRLRRFFGFPELKEGCTLEGSWSCNYSTKLGKNKPCWAFSNILRYVYTDYLSNIVKGYRRDCIRAYMVSQQY